MVSHMNTDVRLEVVLVNDKQKRSHARLVTRHLPASERGFRGARNLAVFCIASAVGLFIPVPRFMIPAFLALGVGAFFHETHFHEEVMGGTIECPGCGHGFHPRHKAFNWPKNDDCPKCGAHMLVAPPGSFD